MSDERHHRRHRRRPDLLGISGPYIAGVWIAVKILVVALVALLRWRAALRRSHAAPKPAGGGG